MKWSAFIAGGIVGMAGAAMLASKRPGVFKSIAGAASGAWNGMRGNRLDVLVKSGLESFAMNEGVGVKSHEQHSGQGIQHKATSHQSDTHKSVEKAASHTLNHSAQKLNSSAASNASGEKSKEHKQAWNRIEQLVESDPQVKRETNKIMAENANEHTH